MILCSGWNGVSLAIDWETLDSSPLELQDLPGISMVRCSLLWPVPPVIPVPGISGPTHLIVSPVYPAQSLGMGCAEVSPQGRKRLAALAPVGAPPGPAWPCWGIPGCSTGGAGASGHCGAPEISLSPAMLSLPSPPCLCPPAASRSAGSAGSG